VVAAQDAGPPPLVTPPRHHICLRGLLIWRIRLGGSRIWPWGSWISELDGVLALWRQINSGHERGGSASLHQELIWWIRLPNPVTGVPIQAGTTDKDASTDKQLATATMMTRGWAQQAHGWTRQAFPCVFLFFVFRV